MNNNHKTVSIYHWKRIGVISKDFNKLYENHMKINNCKLCNVLFNNEINNNKRCLDHDHKTGLYRQTICMKCNKKFDRKFPKNNKSGHKYINIEKQKRKNGLYIYFVYQRFINDKRIIKASVSKIKLIAFSFIQQLKSNI